jgi:lysophospholipase L1-like esterase
MMEAMNRRILPTLLAALFAFPTARLLAVPGPSAEDEILGHSLVSSGDASRLQQIMAKARDGGRVTVAVIGGSITAGAKASAPDKRYGNLIADWWRRRFPQAKVQFINAGIGATGSNFGALRAQRDLLSRDPDFVVVEYAVNDPNTQAAAETLEGLLRQILARPNRAAVMLLFTMDKGGHNAQEWHSRVGLHYSLPMVSFRDALWPQIQAGTMKWEDVEADMVHPNDRGHAYCAAFVCAVLEKVRLELPPDGKPAEIKPFPRPLLSDLFEHTALFEAEALKPVVNEGWIYDAKLKAWKSEKPGSVIEFDLAGRVIVTMHHVVKGPMGKARVSVDGEVAKELNGWFDQTWGGYSQSNEIARLEKPGTHRVRFELLDAKSAGSTGNEFRILGLGVAGTTSE